MINRVKGRSFYLVYMFSLCSLISPLRAVDIFTARDFSLNKVDQAGVGEDGHRHQDEQQPELLDVRVVIMAVIHYQTLSYLVSLLQSTKY